MFRWYLVQTKSGREQIAQTNLLRQHYEVYLPRLVQTVRRAGRWCERVGPLFPAYLFLGLREGEQTLGPVRSSLGVNQVVRFGSRYAPVDERIIRGLRAREDRETGLHRLTTRVRPVPGERVMITGCPFDGLEGLFEREAGNERVVVLLKLLGQETRVRVQADCVVPRSVV